MPFLVDDRAFSKVLDSLVKRGLLKVPYGGTYLVTDEGKAAAIEPLKCKCCGAVLDEFYVCPYGCQR